ncbi:MAG TPA: hypothetical protein VL181_02570 [Holophagaceae bacterium]|jgi:hypothetical protein|nr:hypothetical protein [Holophagaceae bacterium]
MLNGKKKLVLSVETLRNLTNVETEFVQGGALLTRLCTDLHCGCSAGTASVRNTIQVYCC